MSKGYEAANRHRTWTCPFFKWDGINFISCEGGRVSFPDRTTAEYYMEAYCAALPGWQECTVAAALYAYYEQQEEIKDEERRQDKNAGKSE